MKKNNRKTAKAKFIAKGKTADILIYDDIGEEFFGGGISAKQFADDLKALGSVNLLNVYINSMGGSVFEGLTIYNQLHRHEAAVNVHIDGMAASIASVIAMAGDHIAIAENGMMMIHRPMGGAVGTSEDMRQVANALDKVEDTIIDTYASRSGRDRQTLADMVASETWLSAHEAFEVGLVEEITAAKKMAAYADISKYNYKNMPSELPTAIYTVKPDAPNRKKYAEIIQMQKRAINL